VTLVFSSIRLNRIVSRAQALALVFESGLARAVVNGPGGRPFLESCGRMIRRGLDRLNRRSSAKSKLRVSDQAAANSGRTRDFLELIHTEFTARRDAADQRAILLSALSVAILAAIVALAHTLVSNLPVLIQPVVFAIVFALALFSAGLNLSVVLPIRRSRRVRKEARPESLTWFFDVSTYKPLDYQAKVDALSPMELNLKLAQLDVDIAKLLRARYRAMIRAGRALKLSLYATGIVILLNSLFPFAVSLVALIIGVQRVGTS
jgi:hypothetical protein